MTNKISCEYLAGILDGEGSFAIRRWNKKHDRVGYAATVSLVMRRDGRFLLEEINDKFGGHLANRNPRAPSKPISRLDWHGPEARSLCELVVPFLILKCDQAKILLEFEKLRNSWSPYLSVRDENGRLRGFGPDFYKEAEALYRKCRKLKEYEHAV